MIEFTPRQRFAGRKRADVGAAAILSAAAALCVPAAGRASPSPSPNQVRECLDRMFSFLRTISTEGGYCGIYSLDLKKRYGEAAYQPVERGSIWIQPPGTPSVGKLFLRAWRATGERRYLKDAHAVGEALRRTQSRCGGWWYVAPVTDVPARRPPRATFDDNTSQEAISFLLELNDAVKDEKLSECLTGALEFLDRSRYPNGGWPQVWPRAKKYHAYLTFNDAAINDCIRVALEAYDRLGKKKYLEIALKGGEFIRLSQLPEGGWAQQYDLDLKPAWARAFEPPGVCSAVTARNIRTLLRLYERTGRKRFLEPIGKAVSFLKKVRLPSGLWARLYELGTLKPIYGDRDGKIHYTLREISEERRKGYAWESEFGIPGAIRAYERALAGKPAFPPPTPPTVKTLRAGVEAVLKACDEKGRFTRGERIYIHDFVKNGNLLCSYLEALRR